MIGLDWGTTSLRAWRFAPDGTVLAAREAPRGIMAVPAGGFPAALHDIVGDWIAAGDRRVLLCGMVGSRQGWVEAPYLSCPAGAAEIARATVPVPFADAEVRLVPGLTARDAADVPEVMRGEETKIIGLLPELGPGAATVCLPGTHPKWIDVEAGRITRFATAMTGEAFAALSQHTILGRMMAPGAPHHPGAFARGIARAKQKGGLLHHLFGTRTHALMGELAEAEGASYLSGLLIGHEVAAALEAGVAPPIHLTGSAALEPRYAEALSAFGIPFRIHASDAAARGLVRIAQEVFSAS